MRRLLGKYQLGWEEVLVFVDYEQCGGRFDCLADGSGRAEILIGLNHPDFSDALSVALHEAVEFLACRMRLRYRSSKFNDDSADYRFFFDHSELGEVCSRASIFIARAFIDLQRAFRKGCAHRRRLDMERRLKAAAKKKRANAAD